MVIQHLRRHLQVPGCRDFLLCHPYENIPFIDHFMQPVISNAAFEDTLDIRGFQSLRKRTQSSLGWLIESPRRLRSDGLVSLGKRGPEHRQTASRLGFGRFILQNIPVFREHAVGHSDDIGGDPISGPSSSRKPAMDDHVIVFGNGSRPARTSATLACS
jgi:hypothetical protein